MIWSWVKYALPPSTNATPLKWYLRWWMNADYGECMETKYPKINIPRVGEDGNAFAILGRVKRVMRRAGLPDSEWEAFKAEATSGDYDNVLLTVMKWFDVDADLDDYDEEEYE